MQRDHEMITEYRYQTAFAQRQMRPMLRKINVSLILAFPVCGVPMSDGTHLSMGPRCFVSNCFVKR